MPGLHGSGVGRGTSQASTTENPASSSTAAYSFAVGLYQGFAAAPSMPRVPSTAISTVGSFFGHDGVLDTIAVEMMRASIARLSPQFNSTRMVAEYVERLYVPAHRGAAPFEEVAA